MVLAFKLPGRPEMRRISCACHMLNTIYQNFINQKPRSVFLMPAVARPVLDLIKKCKVLVTHCKQAYLVRELSVAPVQACETRWKTTVDMLDSIVRVYGEPEGILFRRDETDKLPASLEFMKAIVDMLRPLKKLTLALSYSSSPTIHLVVPHFFRIKKERVTAPELDDMEEYKALEAFRVHACRVVEAKLTIEDVHKTAVFLNPPMKKLLMFTPEEQRSVLQAGRKELAAMGGSLVATTSTAYHGLDMDPEFHEYTQYADVGPSARSLDEVNVYLSMPPPPSTKPLFEI
ncbi:hypothetical protein RvY_18780-2 [Ramazzottius varieornatus]|uniref:HAT C-terminal dimerisation domain-containing protein n=1 Tax=Ramazzottius varieornatus TaxID=947166 RepID=A0A1D1W8F5_RAMVA|nr:hypothetical protein RvY_18780-2 [Ramazzottius varieornatus]